VTSYVHLLSKEARRKIIEVLASSRGVRRLADELGVTPAAVSKYLQGGYAPLGQGCREGHRGGDA